MNLKALNWAAATAHLGALLGFTYAFRNQPPSARSITVYRNALDTSSDTPLNSCTSVDFPMVAKAVGKPVDPLNLLQIYFGISVVAHAFYALDPGGVYSRAVASGHNPYRWFEYAASASTMQYTLALLDGDRNGAAAGLAAGSIGALNLLGGVNESLLMQAERKSYFDKDPYGKRPPRVQRNALYMSTLVAWILLFLSFYTTLSAFQQVLDDVKAVPGAKPVPSWLKFIGLNQLFTFALFGSLQFLQLRELWRQDKAMLRGDPVQIRAYEHYEALYIALSFGSKLTFGSFLAYGLLKRTTNCTTEASI